jgi:hypothetical protein
MTTWNKGQYKRLGVTETGLRVLSKAVAGRPISGAGAGQAAQPARAKLIRDGYLLELPGEAGWPASLMVTDKGLGVVRRARAAGW